MTSGSTVIKQLTDAIYTVPAENRAGAVFVATDTFLAAMAGMVASDGKPLNIVTFVNNVPYIMGYKVVSTPATAASTVGTCVAVFGNLNQYRIAKFGNGAYFYKKLAAEGKTKYIELEGAGSIDSIKETLLSQLD